MQDDYFGAKIQLLKQVTTKKGKYVIFGMKIQMRHFLVIFKRCGQERLDTEENNYLLLK